MGTQFSPRRSRLDTFALYIDRWLGAIGTGLGRVGRRLFLRVGPPRAALDGLVVNGLALLVVWLLDPRPPADDPGWLSYPLILDLSLVSAFRLRLPPGASWRQNLRNALLCQLLLLPFCVAWALVLMSQGQPYESLFGVLNLGTPLWQITPVVLLEILFIFMALRGALRLWIILERLRRLHLRWQLTAALLLIAGLSQFLSVIAEGLAALQDSMVTAHVAPIWVPLWVVLFLVFYFLPLFVFGVIPVLIVITVVFVVFSYIVMRGFTHGLETLADKADALGAGNYDERVVVHGEDEVGRLEQHFNRMAGDLQRALVDLRDERDALKAEKELTQQLKAEIVELHVEIDQQRRTRDVAEITGTEYFHNLQAKAAELRARRARPVGKE